MAIAGAETRAGMDRFRGDFAKISRRFGRDSGGLETGLRRSLGSRNELPIARGSFRASRSVAEHVITRAISAGSLRLADLSSSLSLAFAHKRGICLRGDYPRLARRNTAPFPFSLSSVHRLLLSLSPSSLFFVARFSSRDAVTKTSRGISRREIAAATRLARKEGSPSGSLNALARRRPIDPPFQSAFFLLACKGSG